MSVGGSRRFSRKASGAVPNASYMRRSARGRRSVPGRTPCSPGTMPCQRTMKASNASGAGPRRMSYSDPAAISRRSGSLLGELEVVSRRRPGEPGDVREVRELRRGPVDRVGAVELDVDALEVQPP